MKKVILHVGAPKTGSTFLQKHFCENRDILRTEGIYYPIDPGVSKIAANAKFLATLLEGKPSLRFMRSFPDLDISDFSASSAYSTLLKDWDQNNETLVLSAENLNYSHAESMRNLIKDDMEVTVILYVRQQDKWIESYFNQLIKAGLTKSTVEGFVDAVLDQSNQEYYSPDWHLHYHGWKKHFEDCRIVFFEDAKECLLKSFYDASDLDIPESVNLIERKQVSLNVYQLAYLMEISQDVSFREFNRCKSISNHVSIKISGNKKISFLSAVLAEKIQSEFRESNEMLFKELQINRCGYTEYERDDIEHIPINRFVESDEYLSFKSECEKHRLDRVA